MPIPVVYPPNACMRHNRLRFDQFRLRVVKKNRFFTPEIKSEHIFYVFLAIFTLAGEKVCGAGRINVWVSDDDGQYVIERLVSGFIMLFSSSTCHQLHIIFYSLDQRHLHYYRPRNYNYERPENNRTKKNRIGSLKRLWRVVNIKHDSRLSDEKQ